MGKVISFINDKGGVAKSTSTVCLASYLMAEGKRVAVVDVDARHSCLDWAALADRSDYPTPPLMVGNSNASVGGSNILKLKEDYDFVLVDGMSSFVTSGRRDVIASIIKATDYILIPPTRPDPIDLWALAELTDMVKSDRKSLTVHPRPGSLGLPSETIPTNGKSLFKRKRTPPLSRCLKLICPTPWISPPGPPARARAPPWCLRNPTTAERR